MGNAESVAADTLREQTHEKEHSNPIEKREFICKFDPCLAGLGEALWNASFSSELITQNEYKPFLSRLTEPSDKLQMFATLAFRDGINEKSFQELIVWLKFGQTFSDSLETALFGSLFASIAKITDVNDAVSRLTAYQDTAEDLSRFVLHTLTSNTPLSIDFNVISGFSTLLTFGSLWLFSNVLSSPFKRPAVSRLGNAAPLEIEQLQHLQQLYDSTVHGFSFTRIKELAFDYDGPLILLMRADNFFFCLASDQGLKDSLKTYGGIESRLFKIEPEFTKLVSGRSSKLATPRVETGIIYSNFTMKTARRGLLVGHQPLTSPAIEINDGFTELSYTGSPPMKLTHIEIWAAGPPERLTQLQRQKAWELTQVNKEKNRKFKLDDWRESADRHILSMVGMNVNYSEQAGVSNEPQQRKGST